MTVPTIQQVFGSNCTQDSVSITISKADLESVGLTALTENNGQSLFAAIVLKAGQSLTNTAQTNDGDIKVTVEKGFDSLVSRNNLSYLQYQYSVNMQKVNTSTTVDPDDF